MENQSSHSLPSSGERIALMLLDHVLMTIPAGILMLPFFFLNLAETMKTKDPSSMLSYWSLFFPFTIIYSLYLNKDAIQARSLAKRIIKAQVINVQTQNPAGPLRCFVRNLTGFLWPIEVILVLTTPERRRLGDFIAGTQVVKLDEGNAHSEPVADWGQVLLAVLLGIGILTLIAVPIWWFVTTMFDIARQEGGF